MRATVCTVLYDDRALTTVARLYRMNIKYKRYRSLSLSLSLSFSLSLTFVGRVIAHEQRRPAGATTENNCHYHVIAL